MGEKSLSIDIDSMRRHPCAHEVSRTLFLTKNLSHKRTKTATSKFACNPYQLR